MANKDQQDQEEEKKKLQSEEVDPLEKQEALKRAFKSIRDAFNK